MQLRHMVLMLALVPLLMADPIGTQREPNAGRVLALVAPGSIAPPKPRPSTAVSYSFAIVCLPLLVPRRAVAILQGFDLVMLDR